MAIAYFDCNRLKKDENAQKQKKTVQIYEDIFNQTRTLFKMFCLTFSPNDASLISCGLLTLSLHKASPSYTRLCRCCSHDFAINIARLGLLTSRNARFQKYIGLR